MSLPPIIAAVLGCLIAFVLSGCADKAETQGGGEIVISLLPTNGASAAGDVTTATVDAIRSRLGRIGFEGIEVLPKGNDELVLRFSRKPDNAAQLLEQAVSRLGNLELLRLHPKSDQLSKDLRLLSEAGPEWGMVSGEGGMRLVVGETALLTNKQISKIEVRESSPDSATFDVVAHIDANISRRLKGLRSALGRAPLALILDGQVLEAPLQEASLNTSSIILSTQIEEAAARELAFILEAPLVVPLQIRDARGM